MTRAALFAAILGLLLYAQTDTGQPPFSRGPRFGPDYFPIAVWLQNPDNAERYKSAGINLYVGLWQGPTEQQLARLKTAGMPVICSQNAVGLKHLEDPIIVGWMHEDEPDNAQPVRDPATGKQSWGPPVPPQKVVEDYRRMRAADPSRPVFLNLGQGVANDEWIGRGPGAKPEDYLTYVKGADILSFDVYPVAGLDKPEPENYLWYVPKGVERLVRWTEGRKRVWCVIECTRIQSGRRPSPAQVRSEIWMAIIHGATGITYFVHEWKPRFNEHALLDDPEMLAAVTALNREIRDLAPIINSPSIKGLDVKSESGDAPVAAMLKRRGDSFYLFAVGMRNRQARATFVLPGVRDATAEEAGKERSIPVRSGRFADSFGPYQPRIYRIRPGG